MRIVSLATFLVGQRDNNAITNATNEFKRVLILASDFVHVMSQSGNYVDRVVLSSPYTAISSSWYFLANTGLIACL